VLRTPRETRCSSVPASLSPGEPIPGSRVLNEKRKLFPGQPATSPSSYALPLSGPPRGDPYSATRFRNINRIPFRPSGALFLHAPLISALAFALGSTDPCSTAVHMEPFSTTVLKVLTRVFATTTKICTDDGSRRARARSFYAVATPSYSPRLKAKSCSRGGPVWARRWSAIHFQG
jgi:hypothetical protein